MLPAHPGCRPIGVILRILLVVHQYPPEHIGGTELYTQNLARRLLEAGHTPSILCPSESRPEGQTNQPVDESGLRIYRVPLGPQSRNQVFLSTFRKGPAYEAIVRILEKDRPELVHIQHLMGLPADLGDLFDKTGIPYLITIHDYWYGCANAQLITNYDGSICHGPDQRFYNCGRCAIARAGRPQLQGFSPGLAPLMAYRNRKLCRVLANARQVIAPTYFVQHMYREMGLPTDNMIVVPHGIEVPGPGFSRSEERKKSVNKAGLHIGYVGSLGWQKGVHNLVQAVNELPLDEVRLSIYGNLSTFPEYVEELKAMAVHPGIHFAGPVSREALWSAMANLDVLVLPTLWYEASPLTIQEAFAVQVPIIASRIGAMEEKIRDGVDGLLVPPDDPTALRDTLSQLIGDPQILERLRQGIRPVYTIADHTAEIERIYRGVIA